MLRYLEWQAIDGRAWVFSKLDDRDLKVLSTVLHSRHNPSGISNIYIAYIYYIHIYK
jgi:hypothetical protein